MNLKKFGSRQLNLLLGKIERKNLNIQVENKEKIVPVALMELSPKRLFMKQSRKYLTNLDLPHLKKQMGFCTMKMVFISMVGRLSLGNTLRSDLERKQPSIYVEKCWTIFAGLHMINKMNSILT